MGWWFSKFLKSNGYNVVISDRNIQAGRTRSKEFDIKFATDYLAAARASDIVVLATPTKVSNRILNQLGRELRKGILIVEISSMKAPVRRAISALQKKGFSVLSIHPMFGPGTKKLVNRSILVVSRTHDSKAEQLLSIFRRLGARMIPCSMDEHDTLATIVITLPHLMSISLIETLRSLRVDMNEINMASGTTFRLHSLVAEAIYQEDHVNEISILADSKTSVLQAFSEQVRIMLNIIRANPERLLRILNTGRSFVESDRHFADSYERFNSAVQAALS